ncbi:hypothetical protein EYC84_005705 [Monilinia fructicola]|uniref:Uncharacterized protein n=1 Tax=Monilinia fructicola TaxID=38448 RepID=A0A5M9K2H2_MONFR|nr:hypothetical protein EYC84_005705 [Monilinia fructicola]
MVGHIDAMRTRARITMRTHLSSARDDSGINIDILDFHSIYLVAYFQPFLANNCYPIIYYFIHPSHLIALRYSALLFPYIPYPRRDYSCFPFLKTNSPFLSFPSLSFPSFPCRFPLHPIPMSIKSPSGYVEFPKECQ